MVKSARPTCRSGLAGRLPRPGDIWTSAAFLTGAKPLPVFLADRLVTWGIDFRWTSVPAGVTDFSFMKKWGIEQDARDLGPASAPPVSSGPSPSAATARSSSRWSRGGQIGYATSRREPDPQGLRRSGLRSGGPLSEDGRAAAPHRRCQRQQATEAMIAAAATLPRRRLIATLGTLAATTRRRLDPDPNLTNRRRTARGEATFTFFPGVERRRSTHFTAAPSRSGQAAGLLYSTRRTSSPSSGPPFPSSRTRSWRTPTRPLRPDGRGLRHPSTTSPSVFYVGAGGGFASSHLTTTLLGRHGRDDSRRPQVPAPRVADYGNADLFLASDPALVWQPT